VCVCVCGGGGTKWRTSLDDAFDRTHIGPILLIFSKAFLHVVRIHNVDILWLSKTSNTTQFSCELFRHRMWSPRAIPLMSMLHSTKGTSMSILCRAHQVQTRFSCIYNLHWSITKRGSCTHAQIQHCYQLKGWDSERGRDVKYKYKTSNKGWQPGFTQSGSRG
jgi:hypothetical protein